MRFRRIYWVTEQFDENGSEVTGVYTSVYDLIESGLGVRDASHYKGGYRVTLCELDTSKAPVLRFSSADHNSLKTDLEPFVRSGEITHEDAARLVEAVEKG